MMWMMVISMKNVNDIQFEVLYLTERESEVAELIAAGFTNNQIADELVVALRTIERHIGAIFEKLAPLIAVYPGNHNRVMIALLWLAGEIPVKTNEVKTNGQMDSTQRYLRFSNV